MLSSLPLLCLTFNLKSQSIAFPNLLSQSINNFCFESAPKLEAGINFKCVFQYSLAVYNAPNVMFSSESL